MIYDFFSFFTLRSSLFMVLHPGHPYEHGGEHGEDVGLDEGYEQLQAIHEDGEEYRHHREASANDRTHRMGDEDDAHKSQYH